MQIISVFQSFAVAYVRKIVRDLYQHVEFKECVWQVRTWISQSETVFELAHLFINHEIGGQWP